MDMQEWIEAHGGPSEYEPGFPYDEFGSRSLERRSIPVVSHQEINEMATIDNMSYEAIAEATGLSVDEVEQIVLSFNYKRG